MGSGRSGGILATFGVFGEKGNFVTFGQKWHFWRKTGKVLLTQGWGNLGAQAVKRRLRAKSGKSAIQRPLLNLITTNNKQKNTHSLLNYSNYLFSTSYISKSKLPNVGSLI